MRGRRAHQGRQAAESKSRRRIRSPYQRFSSLLKALVLLCLPIVSQIGADPAECIFTSRRCLQASGVLANPSSGQDSSVADQTLYIKKQPLLTLRGSRGQ